ncbi:DUF3274 domain-containing protein [Enterobacteriaceae bacterium Kacie_13]|nr:DUF3274 domain-containing protein [Enterobacteriaceae bacterium Kacie_13]
MSDSQSDSLRNDGFLSVGDICRPVTAGEMVKQNCLIKRPLPCIVILVHGVNDVGEAFQNQDEGICKGLNTRLGRTDLFPHSWKEQEFQISDADGSVFTQQCSVDKQTCVAQANRSPIIPFYWGYRPVEKDVWEEDQKRYRAELRDKKDEADLPFDSFVENDAKKIKAHHSSKIDNYANWLDPAKSKGGGTFANATTNIPDMFGPGGTGWTMGLAGWVSRTHITNSGDWSHPIYDNPHRIYQAFAARRLADLILAIRTNPKTKTDTINIVAHSQGTIITMLANMWVQEADEHPADCVILNHSPYSTDFRVIESWSPGNQQTTAGREKTLINFCQLMATNPKYTPNGQYVADDLQKLKDSLCLSNKAQWSDARYSRNNFGKVYNYFCPNDTIVSMQQVQGFGWSGISDPLRAKLGANFNQRVFCKDVYVGHNSGERFEFSKAMSDSGQMGAKNASYDFKNITVDAPILPATFQFKLGGQDNAEEHKKNPNIPADPYRTRLSGLDPNVAKTALANEQFIHETRPLPAGLGYIRDQHTFDAAELTVLSEAYQIEAIRALATGPMRNMIATQVEITRRMNDAELEEAVNNAKNDIQISQHSSIVTSKDVPEKAMAYDLAIGECQAFEHKDIWEGLLLRADWRQAANPLVEVTNYYRNGQLPPEFKTLMNKPEREHGAPKGQFGVVNDYAPSKTRQTPPKDIYGQIGTDTSEPVTELQWAMPKPLV